MIQIRQYTLLIQDRADINVDDATASSHPELVHFYCHFDSFTNFGYKNQQAYVYYVSKPTGLHRIDKYI